MQLTKNSASPVTTRSRSNAVESVPRKTASRTAEEMSENDLLQRLERNKTAGSNVTERLAGHWAHREPAPHREPRSNHVWTLAEVAGLFD